MRTPPAQRGLLALAVLVVAASGCRDARRPTPDATWLRSLERWRADRNEQIGGEEGWLTLVARVWLREGASRVGADPTSEIALPPDRAPPLAGTIIRTGDRLRFVAAEGVEVRTSGEVVRELDVVDDRDDHPTVWSLGTLTFRVIKRQDRFALRVKDRAHPARAAFRGLSFYPPDPALRVRARLEPAPPGKTVRIVNVINQVEDMPSPGTLRFRLDGVSHSLDAVVDHGHEGLFVLFKDATSGHGSYGAGRFLYTGAPAADGSVDLDFNRAFTPPCAFTSFATCPLAPVQNHLPSRIEAGERFEGAHRE